MIDQLQQSRSLFFSMLKIDYGWNGCTDNEHQQQRLEAIFIANKCISCAADEAAFYLANTSESGTHCFRERFDGKPNNKIVDISKLDNFPFGGPLR